MPEKRKESPRKSKTDKDAPEQKAPEADIYNKVLDEAEKIKFQETYGTEGLDAEIALLRVKIAAILETDSDNIKLLLQATNMLAKLVKTRYSINKEQKKGLKDALQNVIKDIAVPLGVAFISKK